MDKYEYNVRVEQIAKLVSEKDYKTAAKISDSIDWRRVRNVSTLTMIGEVYEGCRRYEDAKEILLMAYEKAPIGRRLAYRLAELCIKGNDFEGAKKYYEDFVNLSPNDNRKYELLYEINKKQGVPAAKRVAILEEYAKNDVDERWGLELANCYYEAGMNDKCIKQCDELFLWFGEGEYVVKALELKEMLAPLTEKQLKVKNAAEEAAKEPVKEVVPRDKAKTVNKLKRRAARKAKSASKSVEEQPKERENNSYDTGETKDIRKEQEIIKNVLAEEEVEPVVWEPVKEEQNAQIEEQNDWMEEQDDQIIGQMTIEELLAAYERENGITPETEEVEAEAEAVVVAADEEAKLAEAIEEELIEEEPENEESFWQNAREEESYVEDISEAVSRVTGEMMEEHEENVYSKNALTEEQKETFKQFLYMRGMEEQLINIFQSIAEHRTDMRRSAEGNLLVVGDYKSGKTTLAISVIKEINIIRRRSNRRIAKISGERLNNKGIRETLSQLSDSDLLIEHAGRMSKATLQGLLQFMSGETGGMLVIFEDTKEAMEYILAQVPEARTYFNYYVELREVEIADWVEVAAGYCKENGFKIDDIAKLALSAKISQISKEDFTTEFEDVKRIVDEAMRRYKRRHFFKRKDEENGISVLKEADFK